MPLLVDLAAMRIRRRQARQNPKIIEPLVPVDLVVDHWCRWISPAARIRWKNLDSKFTRNRERYQFLKWGMQAFDTFKVVPPGIGIVHQVNLDTSPRACSSGRRLLSRHARRHRLTPR